MVNRYFEIFFSKKQEFDDENEEAMQLFQRLSRTYFD